MTVRPFVYETTPGRVVFGVGARRQIAHEADGLGSKRILVVAGKHDESAVEEISALLAGRVFGRFSDVAQHVPIEKADAARAMVKDLEVDTVITIGGGSAVGFGKAIALKADVMQIAVPTTYSGSEMTPFWGLSKDGHKQTGTNPRVKPDVVIYDPELTLTLPPEIAGPSGMNALAHCVEALYVPGANPVTTAMALEGIRALARGLPLVTQSPGDLDARTDVLYGAYVAGMALASGGTALHHKTCHVLGGLFGLNHGDMNAVMLGHTVAYNSSAMPAVMRRLEVVLETDNVPVALFELAVAIGAPTTLESIGMPEDGIDTAVDQILVEAAGNVRPLERAAVRRMLDDAYVGRRPN